MNRRTLLPSTCLPCLSKVTSGLGSYPWTCANGHTLTQSSGGWVALGFVAPDDDWKALGVHGPIRVEMGKAR